MPHSGTSKSAEMTTLVVYTHAVPDTQHCTMDSGLRTVHLLGVLGGYIGHCAGCTTTRVGIAGGPGAGFYHILHPGRRPRSRLLPHFTPTEESPGAGFYHIFTPGRRAQEQAFTTFNTEREAQEQAFTTFNTGRRSPGAVF